VDEKEQSIYDRLIQYGHLRRCDCYHGMCLVIPDKLLELMVKRILTLIERKGK